MREMPDDGVTEIGQLPATVARFWPGLTTMIVVVTGERRSHYRAGRRDYFESQGALAEFERQLIQTIRDPDEIHRNEVQPLTAVLWRRVSPERHMRVVVALTNTAGLSNSVITAWRPNVRKYRKAQLAERLLWRRN